MPLVIIFSSLQVILLKFAGFCLVSSILEAILSPFIALLSFGDSGWLYWITVVTRWGTRIVSNSSALLLVVVSAYGVANYGGWTYLVLILLGLVRLGYTVSTILGRD